MYSPTWFPCGSRNVYIVESKYSKLVLNDERYDDNLRDFGQLIHGRAIVAERGITTVRDVTWILTRCFNSTSYTNCKSSLYY